MESLKVVKDYDYYNDKSLKQMMVDMQESSRIYHEENEIHNKKINEQLAEIKSLVKYTLTEQEEQKYANMSMSELITDMENNIEVMRASLDKILDKDIKN